jgi:hypothetical protein
MDDAYKKEFMILLPELFAVIKNKLNLQTTPKIILKKDQDNSNNILGKTAYYNPADKSITLFILNRHPKDILRSFAHECIHLYQHENNMYGIGENESGDTHYAQNDTELRKAEKQAYLLGNMMFRDWEDSKK